ncbi:MAG TPA: M56 family metallopeptidase [Candidatus Acidoferrum sp.]|jgi:Zn-dependent protease with chaperone function|nr:M56 family metallopeptidase [Candidatus Acidoferrum sp.]
MMWPQLQTVAQIAISRVLNSLPEGLLVALFAGVMLRLLPRQNSGTRFAVWFVALLAVAALPLAGVLLIGGVTGGNSMLAAGTIRPLISFPGRWALVLFLAWGLVTCVAMLRLAAGLWRLRVLRRSCITIDGADLEAEVRKTVADFSSSRSVILATSERVSVPAAVGFFKPMIVIPAWALRELTPSELNIVLLHEFAHLRRGDAWTNLLQKFVRAVFLFHPAVWWIESRLSLEREMACDDQVLAEIANPRSYATCLIALLEKSVARRGWAMAQAAVHRGHEASLRLAQILDVTRPQTKHVWKPALGFVGAFSVLCLVVMSRAPRFVAFEPNARALQSGEAHPALLTQSQMSAATATPAAMRRVPSSSLKTIHHQSAAHATRQLPVHRTPAPLVIAARWSPERSPVNAETIGTDNSVVPVSETLLIIRTLQRIGPNSWVWSVDVWRLNLVNSAQDGAEKVPLAKKT